MAAIGGTPVDFESNKKVLPQVLDLHFVCMGEYYSKNDVDKTIGAF